MRCCLRAVMALLRFCKAGERGESQGRAPTPIPIPPHSLPGQGSCSGDSWAWGAPNAAQVVRRVETRLGLRGRGRGACRAGRGV